jgi:hypothetical protein
VHREIKETRRTTDVSNAELSPRGRNGRSLNRVPFNHQLRKQRLARSAAPSIGMLVSPNAATAKLMTEGYNQPRTMSPGQVLLAAFAFACAPLIAPGISTLKGDRRQNSAFCPRQRSRVSGCIARAANTGVPLSRTTEMANSLVIVIKRIFLLLLDVASALQPMKPTAVR